MLNRELEFLPDDDMLAERKAADRGLTTPEFAILLSYTKIALVAELLASDLPEDPDLAVELERYFPTRLRERFGAHLHRHPLRREIIVLRVVNDLVNRAGTTFAFRLGDETGAGAADVTRAYIAARDIFGLGALWTEIEALDGRVSADVQLGMLLRSRVLLERATRWLLRNRRRPLELAATVSQFAAGAATVAEALPTLLARDERELAESVTARLVAEGVPQGLADRVAHMEALVPALDIVEIGRSVDLDPAAVAPVYFELGGRLELHWLRNQIVALPRHTRWDALARAAQRDDLYGEHAALTAEVLRQGAVAHTPEANLQAWLESNEHSISRYLQVLADLRASGAPDLARLSVAVREVRNLIHAVEAPEPSPESPAIAVAKR
jgi:glutamate dehydrogenase